MNEEMKDRMTQRNALETDLEWRNFDSRQNLPPKCSTDKSFKLNFQLICFPFFMVIQVFLRCIAFRLINRNFTNM